MNDTDQKITAAIIAPYDFKLFFTILPVD